MTLRLVIVTPVFNDWPAFGRLLEDLSASLSGGDYRVEIVAIDDCSAMHATVIEPNLPGIAEVRVLRLAANLGHQRAIAVGLVSLADRNDIDLVAVMDSDGEDRPSDLARLLDAAASNPGVALIAQRAKRSEGLLFRIFYRIYVRAFRLLTGQKIDFGNFCLLPFKHLGPLVSRAEIWNNFAATIIRARMPVERVPTERGTRYAGQSQMNLASLVAHGLGAMSVFSEFIFIRILLASTVLLGLVAATAVGVVVVRFFTSFAVPGWATNVFGFLTLMGFQAIMLAVMLAFMLLNNRSSVQIRPKAFALEFVEQTTVLYHAAA